jgi:hypothetical protein
MTRFLPITLLFATAIVAVAAPAAHAAGGGTGKTMSAQVLASGHSVTPASPLLNLAVADGER